MVQYGSIQAIQQSTSSTLLTQFNPMGTNAFLEAEHLDQSKEYDVQKYYYYVSQEIQVH
jgi:hypothetical protein